MTFWSLSELDVEDRLNAEIWAQSPEQQEHIQPYRDDWRTGEIGAQQVMRSPYRLPWVPDPVGQEWRSDHAVLVFGSAYGPFIGGEGWHHELQPQDYQVESSADFMKVFFEKVIYTRSYYSRIAQLASAVIPSCCLLGVVDLCRVAFVRRDFPCDHGGDKIARCAPELFTRYVESTAASNWLWRRILESRASTLVALGTIAEHGLLRLFNRHAKALSICDSQDSNIRFKTGSTDRRWPSQYARKGRKLKDRKEAQAPPYWNIVAQTSDDLPRSWRLTVVPHPTGARGGWDSEYSRMAIRAAYGLGEC